MKIRKQSPLHDILEQVFLYESSIGMRSQRLKTVVQEETLTQIYRHLKLLERSRFQSPQVKSVQGRAQKEFELNNK
jgi:hypothetical protein